MVVWLKGTNVIKSNKAMSDACYKSNGPLDREIQFYAGGQSAQYSDPTFRISDKSLFNYDNLTSW